MESEFGVSPEEPKGSSKDWERSQKNSEIITKRKKWSCEC
jgi:hypothetical protein